VRFRGPAMTPTTAFPDVSAPLASPPPLPPGSVEPPDRAEAFVHLPTVRTVVANVVVVGRLKPLPLPDLDD
ncbi:MAG TPA: hypothetical protein VEI97_00920, partial [bacterium]|nr:hypothetical protein [bacterium]